MGRCLKIAVGLLDLLVFGVIVVVVPYLAREIIAMPWYVFSLVSIGVIAIFSLFLLRVRKLQKRHIS